MSSNAVKMSLIAAVAQDNVIGRDGDIPWHIPSDFAHFKRTTMGKPMVMGRKQFESVGRPLPGRVNIVVTGQQGYQPDGVLVFNDLDAALDHAKTIARADGMDEFFVIGGGEIYKQTMAQADRLYISHVDLTVEGNVYFPSILPSDWKKTQDLPVTPHEKDGAQYSIAVYERVD